MQKRKQKIWGLGSSSADFKTKRVGIRTLGSLDVIKPSEMKETEYTVVGSISTNRRFKGDKAAVAMLTEKAKADVLEHVTFSKLLGYLPTEESGVYLAVRRPRVFLLLLFGLLSASVLTAAVMAVLTVFMRVETPFTPVLDADQVVNTDTNFMKGYPDDEYMEIVGIPSITVSAEAPTIQLGNVAENGVLFMYTVTDENGRVLHQSGWIEPGMASVWNVYESFGGKAGTYHVTILTATQDPQNGAALNSVEQPSEVTVY